MLSTVFATFQFKRSRLSCKHFFSLFIDETPDIILSSNRTFLTPELHSFEYIWLTDDQDRSLKPVLLGSWLGAEGETTGEKRTWRAKGKTDPLRGISSLLLFLLLTLLTESLEGKISEALHSKGQKSLGSTENGNCFVQVVASKS